MMQKNIKELIFNDKTNEPHLEIVRKQLLSIILIVNIFAFPMLLIGIIEAIKLNLIYTTASFVIFYFPILIAYLFRKKLSYKTSVFLLLFSGYSIGFINIIVYGFSGTGLPIFFAIAVLATIFYGIRAGVITILLCSIPMIIVAILMTNDLLAPSIDLMKISTLAISWITAIIVMLFLGNIIIFGFGVIQKSLINSLNFSKNQSADLSKANKNFEALNKELKYANKKLKIAKEKAEESDKLKTEFINNMSHEIRTPMNSILGFSELLNKPNKSEEKRKHYVNIIQNSGNQLMRIIDDILEISKLRTKQVKTIEKEICFNYLLLKLFFIFDIKAKENKTPLYLNKGLSDDHSLIFTDEPKLTKILSNLLENALKFTSKGFIEFGYQLLNNKLEIYVKDTGIGIKPESQKTIFKHFSQEEKELSRNVGGLGLGLSIAKENAELLGGKITLKSKKNKGSIFYITIPYNPSYSKKGNSNSANDNNEIVEKQNEYLILIVEDEEINYIYIETLLKDEIEIDCNTLHVKNGKEAFDICKKNKEIDFIFMDLKMPVMNGFEATKLIKEFRPNLPIIAQTAYTTNEDKEKAFSAGCDDFISKPISEETLNEILNNHLINKQLKVLE